VLELEIEVASLDPQALLAQAEGFLVDDTDGRKIGVVDAVETDAESGEAVTLIVAGGPLGGRRLRADAQAVEVLVPAEQRLVVDPAGLAPAGDGEPAA
jgi:sporulation protein YlmC with PRC-barrel domain